jgi:plasmid stabilization system protein ParE
MGHKIYPADRRRIIEIWHYTDKTWGEKQADKYVRGLHQAIEKAAINKCLWRKIEHEDVKGIVFVRYEHHFVFFGNYRIMC